MVKAQNNFIHFFDFGHGDHYKANLYDILPIKFKKLYQKRYDPLVVGYIKELETDNIVPDIPIVLKKLISNYFPLI